MASITLEQRTKLINLYVGMFKAAPGATTLSAMVQDYEGGKTFMEIAQGLDNASFRAEYPAFLTAEEFAAKLIGNLLGDNVAAGAKAWATNWVVGKVNAGVLTDAEIVWQAVNALSVTDNTNYATAKTILTNKVAVAEYYSVTKAQSSESLSTLQAVISGVTAEESTVTSAKTSIDETVASSVAQTFVLTTGVDTGATFTGGEGNDRFTGTDKTLTSGDVLKGGAGTDTLEITTTAAASLGTGVIAEVETVKSTATVGALSVDLGNFTGVTEVTNTGSTAAVTYNNVQAIPTSTISASSTNLTVNVAATAVIGTEDSATLNISGAAQTASSTFTINGVETLNVSSTGATTGSATNTLTLDGGSALRNVAITGSASANLVANLQGATDKFTGGVTSDDGSHSISYTADGTDLITISMGAGDDGVTVNTALGLASGSTTAGAQSIDGGEGTDTLTSGVNITKATGSNVKGFEKVVLTGTANVVLDTALNDVTTATLAAGTNFTGLEAGGTVIQSAGGTATVDGEAGAITVEVGTATTAGALTQSLSAKDVTSATIVNNAISTDTTSARSVGVSSDSLTSLTVTGTQPTTITGGGKALATVDASGVNGNVTITGATLSATGATITTGAKDDTVTVTAGTNTITTGDGKDTITGGTGNDTITSGAGNDTIDGGKGNDVIDAGAGDDTITLGEGADTVTGGEGADTFIIGGPNTNLASFSTATAPDVIKDFVSGTDKLTIGQTNTKFVGNFASLSLGLANMTANNQSFFVSGENQLYVVATNGTYAATDTVVKLEGVSTISQNDLGFGSQGTGSTITVSTGVADLDKTNKTNASANTTDKDDTISITVANSSGNVSGKSDIDGAGGLDTVNITTTAAGLTNLNATTNNDNINLDNVETVNITVSDTGAAALNLGANVDTGIQNLKVSGDNVGLTATMSADGQTITVNNSVNGGQASTITVNGKTGTVTTGSANDTFNTISVDEVTLDGGAGNDTFNVTAVAVFNDNDGKLATIKGGTGTDSIVFANALTGTIDLTDSTDVSISAVETINLGQVAGGGMTITLNSGYTTLIGDTTNGNIIVKSTAAILDALTTITSAAVGNTFSYQTTDTGAVTVDLSNTTFTTLANVDNITFAAGSKVTLTADENVNVTGTAATDDTYNLTGDLTSGGNATLAATNIEILNINKTQTNNTLTVSDTVKTVNVTQNTNGLTLGNAVTAVNVSGTATATITQDNQALADTITLSGTGDVTINTFNDTATADTITETGNSKVTVNQVQGAGVTTITFASDTSVDTVGLGGTGIIASTDRVVVNGFDAAGEDKINLDVDNTTGGVAAGNAPTTQVLASAGAIAVQTTSDLLIVNFDLGGSTEVLAGDNTGASLLTNLGGALTSQANDEDFYIGAFDNGNFYLYYVNGAGGDTAVGAAEIALIGTFNSVAVGTMSAADFSMIA